MQSETRLANQQDRWSWLHYRRGLWNVLGLFGIAYPAFDQLIPVWRRKVNHSGESLANHQISLASTAPNPVNVLQSFRVGGAVLLLFCRAIDHASAHVHFEMVGPLS